MPCDYLNPFSSRWITFRHILVVHMAMSYWPPRKNVSNCSFRNGLFSTQLGYSYKHKKLCTRCYRNTCLQPAPEIEKICHTVILANMEATKNARGSTFSDTIFRISNNYTDIIKNIALCSV